MICAIMQPTYFPWIVFFDLIDRVDTFVFLDNVKLEKSDWHVRNRIKGSAGEILLVVPVRSGEGRMNTLISTAEVDYRKPWAKKHLRSIEVNYGKTPGYAALRELVEPILREEHSSLARLNMTLIQTLAAKLGITTQFQIASEMDGVSGVKDERIVSICQKLGADEYLSPRGSADYLNRESPGGEVVKNGIKLYYQNYEHPVYDQLFGDFMSHMGCVDLICNLGFDNALGVIRQGARTHHGHMDVLS